MGAAETRGALAWNMKVQKCKCGEAACKSAKVEAVVSGGGWHPGWQVAGDEAEARWTRETVQRVEAWPPDGGRG